MNKNKNIKTNLIDEETSRFIATLADSCKNDTFSIIKEAVDSIHKKDNEWLDFMLIKGFPAIKVFFGCIENKKEITFLISRFLLPFFLKEFPDVFENDDSFLFIKETGEKNFIALKEFFLKIMEEIKEIILLEKLHNKTKKEVSYSYEA